MESDTEIEYRLTDYERSYGVEELHLEEVAWTIFGRIATSPSYLVLSISFRVLESRQEFVSLLNIDVRLANLY